MTGDKGRERRGSKAMGLTCLCPKMVTVHMGAARQKEPRKCLLLLLLVTRRVGRAKPVWWLLKLIWSLLPDLRYLWWAGTAMTFLKVGHLSEEPPTGSQGGASRQHHQAHHARKAPKRMSPTCYSPWPGGIRGSDGDVQGPSALRWWFLGQCPYQADSQVVHFMTGWKNVLSRKFYQHGGSEKLAKSGSLPYMADVAKAWEEELLWRSKGGEVT